MSVVSDKDRVVLTQDFARFFLVDFYAELWKQHALGSFHKVAVTEISHSGATLHGH